MSMYGEMSAAECQRQEEAVMYYVEQVREVRPRKWEGVILEEFETQGDAIRYAKRYENTRVTYYDHGWHTAYEA